MRGQATDASILVFVFAGHFTTCKLIEETNF